MTTLETDTIYALGSGAGRAGVAVIRVSGPSAERVLKQLTGRVPQPRRANLAILKDGSGAPIDRALVLWFPAPASFTGEDVAELHVHGGRAVIAATLAALAAVPGCRPAVAGEFTRRAFANAKLDLTAVEGLGDLIAADTEAQRRFALRVAEGEHRARYDEIHAAILSGLALIEATIDFADEDIDLDAVLSKARDEAVSIRQRIDAVLAAGVAGERLRDGVQVVIAGRPNAGKSTLLNRLARRDVAIVSPEAGTTRDTIEVHLDLGGYPVTLVDTAGLRASGDIIEREGVRRAEARAASADLILSLVAPDVPEAALPGAQAPIWRIATKADLGDVDSQAEHRLSAETGVGIDVLLAALGRFAAETIGADSDAPVIARERHRASLAEAATEIDSALQRWQSAPVEIVAEHMRRAGVAIGRITGRIDVEDVLEVIFARFCIGK